MFYKINPVDTEYFFLMTKRNIFKEELLNTQDLLALKVSELKTSLEQVHLDDMNDITYKVKNIITCCNKILETSNIVDYQQIKISEINKELNKLKKDLKSCSVDK